MIGVAFSKRALASYVLDWIALVAFGLICYGLNKLTPVYHPFSLLDLSIAYPNGAELVSTTDLVLAAIVGPAAIIVLVCVIIVPGPNASRRVPWRALVVRKVWEINVGLLGLALSELTSLLLTTGMKNIFGKPRPDMLARCDPDPQAVRDHVVGFAVNEISPAWVLVDQTICRQTDRALLNDGFRSFPSGHSSTSWAGLLYLSLYLCAKFGVAFPHLSPLRHLRHLDETSGVAEYSSGIRRGSHSSEAERKPIFGSAQRTYSPFAGRRGEAAAPPVYMHFLLFIPIGVAIFICASRYYDYRHHGFDILSGSLIGIVTSWYSFRMYHLPVGRGAGWSWGPRSAGRAFGIGVGTEGWVSEEDEDGDCAGGPLDMEMGALPSAGTAHAVSSARGEEASHDYAEGLMVPGRAS